MSNSQTDVAQHHRVTPPPKCTHQLLTPPSTNKKLTAGPLRVIALFRQSQAGTHTSCGPWMEFQLAQGDFDRIQDTLRQDKVLWGFVDDKIRYDYDEDKRRLVVRMPTATHELFIDKLEDEIRSQLKGIRGGSDRNARFAQKVQPARSTELRFSASASSSKSKYEPDASFIHDDAEYPGVIIEVAYSQKKKRLGRLAENYLLDSDASVRVVVGLDIDYGNESRKAALSIWRPRLFETADGLELRAVEEVADEVFRDDEGNPIESLGLRLCLSDFTCEELVREELGSDNTEIQITGKQLCQYLDGAESKARRALRKHSFARVVIKRKRSETPPEEMKSGDEAKYAEQEERAVKRVADDDVDYNESPSFSSLSE